MNKNKFVVELLAVGGNIAPAAVTLVANLEPWLRAVLIVGQLAVAAVTVVYILRKIRGLKQPLVGREPEEDDKLNDTL